MKVAVVGASGYAGAELVALLSQHSEVSGIQLLVSENSESDGLLFSDLYPRFQGVCDLPLHAFNNEWLTNYASDVNAVFFATPHEYSQLWADKFLDLGVKVFDLSGAFRLNNASDYPKYYGFEHSQESLLKEAVYGLAEWQSKEIENADLIAVPGCYPTASLLSIKPISSSSLLQPDSLIVVNGISGVSGAGRKTSFATSFNEVSLTAYNILQHRHQPEIAQECGNKVVFNPHLAPYKRGLLATVTMQLKGDVSAEDVDNAFSYAYQHTKLVKLSKTWPKVDDVANTPFACLHYKFDQESQVIVVSCVIDNLLKGAASQAIQCFNIRFGFNGEHGLLSGKN